MEVNGLINKALKNIQKIYYEYSGIGITDIDKFINEQIKGTHITYVCAEIVQKKLIPKHIIFIYIIIKPILNFYHFVKTAILRSINLEE